MHPVALQAEEAEAEAMRMIRVYEDAATQLAAIPVIAGAQLFVLGFMRHMCMGFCRRDTALLAAVQAASPG
jgi:hypothetical protein